MTQSNVHLREALKNVPRGWKRTPPQWMHDAADRYNNGPHTPDYPPVSLETLLTRAQNKLRPDNHVTHPEPVSKPSLWERSLDCVDQSFIATLAVTGCLFAVAMALVAIVLKAFS